MCDSNFQGTIKEFGARRLVPKILYVKFLFFVLEVGWLFLGSYWSADQYEYCDAILVNTVRLLVGLAWVGVIVFIVMMGKAL